MAEETKVNDQTLNDSRIEDENQDEDKCRL